MNCIFIDAADTYAGPGFDTNGILKKYSQALEGIPIVARYSITGTRGKLKFVHLKDYLYSNKSEKAKGGCLVDGGTTVGALRKCLGQVGELETGKNFYIISANSAHHFSYILSRYAFKTNQGNWSTKKVVINFDMHVDYGDYVRTRPAKKGIGEYGKEAISCGRWGGFHVGYWDVFSPKGAEYVVLCACEHGKDPYRVYSGKDSYIKLTGEAAVLNKLKSYKAKTHEVYVTLDRDFMIDNGTKYGDKGCKYNSKTGLEFVEKCIKVLKENDVNIVGGDITGLPVKSGINQGFRHDKKQFDEAVNHITRLYHCLT